MTTTIDITTDIAALLGSSDPGIYRLPAGRLAEARELAAMAKEARGHGAHVPEILVINSDLVHLSSQRAVSSKSFLEVEDLITHLQSYFPESIKEEELDDLKKWASGLPAGSRIVARRVSGPDRKLYTTLPDGQKLLIRYSRKIIVLPEGCTVTDGAGVVRKRYSSCVYHNRIPGFKIRGFDIFVI